MKFLVPCAPGCPSGFTCTDGICKCGVKACDVEKGFTCVNETCKCAKDECDSKSDTCNHKNNCVCGNTTEPCEEGSTCTNGICKGTVEPCDDQRGLVFVYYVLVKLIYTQFNSTFTCFQLFAF